MPKSLGKDRKKKKKERCVIFLNYILILYGQEVAWLRSIRPFLVALGWFLLPYTLKCSQECGQGAKLGLITSSLSMSLALATED